MNDTIILGIESSCDETSVAIMQERRLLAQKTTTQLIHEQYGGVVPELAARQHQENIIPVLEATLQATQRTINDINLIAVTQGPGLLGSLLVGISFAHGLSKAKNIPLIGIHHTKAHLLANFIEPPYPTFPFLGLIISGGHTQLVHVKNPVEMILLGSTLDDAVGEAFDKIAKMMGFPYPGGIYIDKHARQGNPKKFSFPRTKVAGFDFSFSGVKTSFLYFLQKQQQADPSFLEQYRDDLCASIQETLIDILMQKVIYATEKLKLNTIVLGGGVACNSALRNQLYNIASKYHWQIHLPAPIYCTDNAAMIAIAGYFMKQTKKSNSIIPNPRMAF